MSDARCQTSDKLHVRDFTDLVVWQKGHKFRLGVYKVSKVFPAEEKYGLKSQVRKSASSFTANIAEGFGRVTLKDQEHFYVQANGSLFESRDHLILARDLGYISPEVFSLLDAEAHELHRIMNGFLRAHRARRTSGV